MLQQEQPRSRIGRENPEARNLWPVVAIASCLTLVGATMALAPRARTPMQVAEMDGYRQFAVRRFGLFLGRSVSAD